MKYAGRSDLEGEIRTLQRATQNGDDLGNVLGDKLSSRHGIEGTDSLLSLSSPRRYRPSTRTSDSWEQAERTKGNNAGHSGSRLLTWEITSQRLWRTRASLSTWNNWGRKDKTRENSRGSNTLALLLVIQLAPRFLGDNLAKNDNNERLHRGIRGGGNNIKELVNHLHVRQKERVKHSKRPHSTTCQDVPQTRWNELRQVVYYHGLHYRETEEQ